MTCEEELKFPCKNLVRKGQVTSMYLDMYILEYIIKKQFTEMEYKDIDNVHCLPVSYIFLSTYSMDVQHETKFRL